MINSPILFFLNKKSRLTCGDVPVLFSDILNKYSTISDQRPLEETGTWLTMRCSQISRL